MRAGALLVIFMKDSPSEVSICGDDVRRRISPEGPKEAFEYLNELGEKSHTWTGPSATNSTNRSRQGIYQLREEDNLKSQIDLLTKQIEALKTKEGRGIHMVARAESQEPCFIYGRMEHLAKDCPTHNEMRGL